MAEGRRRHDAGRVREGDRQGRLTEPGHPELDCGVGSWDAAAYGNHRIVVRVAVDAAAVRTELPWRRNDPEPERVDVVVLSAASGLRVRNVVREHADADRGVLWFEPVDGAGDYHVYYLPYAHLGSAHYPSAVYRTYTPTAEPAWVHAVVPELLPHAAAVRYEAVSALDGFAPEGFAATRQELSELRAAHAGESFLAFGAGPGHGFGRGSYLPASWLHAGPGAPARGTAAPGEPCLVPLGVYALDALDDVDVDLAGCPFPWRCLNTRGTDAHGSPMRRTVTVPAGHAQSLWLRVDVPHDAEPGRFEAAAVVHADGRRQRVPVSCTVAADAPAPRNRLAWLDSTVAQDGEVVAPFLPVQVEGSELRILGRTVRLGPCGLPEAVGSSFARTVTGVDGEEHQLLAAPVRLDVGQAWTFDPYRIVEDEPATARWQVTGRAGDVCLALTGELDASGCLEYRIELCATPGARLDDVRLTLPLRRDAARYLMGLGHQGRECPDELDWTWDPASRNQDAVWVGDVTAGVQVALRDGTYRRPLNTNYYAERPLVPPLSWCNGGRGGIRVRTTGDTRLVEAYSGPHVLTAGEPLRFDLRLLLTPAKPIEPRRQLTERYYHAYASPADVAAYGATVVNLHHATPPNPYLNDPMRAEEHLARYVAEAHERGLRVKVYATVRELTRHAPELPALLSLGDEVVPEGPGGGHAWLREHLPRSYVPGWVSPTVDDVAVVVAGGSRWENVYVRTVDHLARTAGVDGVYVDDAAFDRVTMRRLRTVLQRARPAPLVDLHSANQFREPDGYASSANLYLELFPYLDRLWLGEYVDYEGTDPAYWLVELSGVPFGVMGEMLQDGGNPWRGMVFGMTARAPDVDNRALWRAWDELALPELDMVGWWSGDGPVRTDHQDVLATTWQGPRRAVVALASWAPGDVDVRLEVAWDELGIDPAAARVTAPEIEGFQPAATFTADDAVPVRGGRGWLLRIDPADVLA